jgi:hypothetical protein
LIFFRVDGRHSRIYVSTPRGPTVDVFLALMVGAPGSLLAPLGDPPLTFFRVDGGCSMISISTTQGPAIDVL